MAGGGGAGKEKVTGDKRKVDWGRQTAKVNPFAPEMAANKEKSHFVTWPDVQVRYFNSCVERVGLGEQKTKACT